MLTVPIGAWVMGAYRAQAPARVRARRGRLAVTTLILVLITAMGIG